MPHAVLRNVLAVSSLVVLTISLFLLTYTSHPRVLVANQIAITDSGHHIRSFWDGLVEKDERFKGGRNPYIQPKPAFIGVSLKRVQGTQLWRSLGFTPPTVHAQGCGGAYQAQYPAQCAYGCGGLYQDTNIGSDPCSGFEFSGYVCQQGDGCSLTTPSNTTCCTCFSGCDF